MRKPVGAEQAASRGDTDGAFAARVCAWCRGALGEADAAAPRTSHGICEPCLEDATRWLVDPARSGSAMDREEP